MCGILSKVGIHLCRGVASRSLVVLEADRGYAFTQRGLLPVLIPGVLESPSICRSVANQSFVVLKADRGYVFKSSSSPMSGIKSTSMSRSVAYRDRVVLEADRGYVLKSNSSPMSGIERRPYA